MSRATMRHADRSMGYARWGDWLAEEWPLDRVTAYERMKVAAYTTRIEAQRYGMSALPPG
jgi:hypothetical protein